MLYEQNFPQMPIADEEWKSLDLLYEILHPVEIILKAVCADDTGLLKAEYPIESLLNKLNIVGNPLALNLRERLMHRYNKRRNVETLTLLSEQLFLTDAYLRARELHFRCSACVPEVLKAVIALDTGPY
ncbi:Hypothetical predicted protein [Octopus vulgaris]|uniref:Uncharacterized protein n=1 Tax=Octopus vulgaris TaxID=6645 RepID=A0AA36C386_OCTVU|nr:Hypothetical predicted protein [Octopus vulgaris]